MPLRGYHDGAEEHRLGAQDDLRSACRAMGMLGVGGRFAIQVCCYERRVKSQDALLYLRESLSRLAEHLRQERRAAEA
jgi:hypothetical protein